MWCLFIFTFFCKIPPALIITHPLFLCIESKCALNDGANEHSDNSNLQSVCQKLVQPALKVLWNSLTVTFEQRTKRLLFEFEFEMSWTDWPTATLFLWHNKQEEVFIKRRKGNGLCRWVHFQYPTLRGYQNKANSSIMVNCVAAEHTPASKKQAQKRGYMSLPENFGTRSICKNNIAVVLYSRKANSKTTNDRQWYGKSPNFWLGSFKGQRK